MNLLSPSPLQQIAPVVTSEVDGFDPETEGYIRLLSAVLEQSCDSVAKQLSASDAVVGALAIKNDQTAA